MLPDMKKNIDDFRRLAKDALLPRPEIPGSEIDRALEEAAERRGTRLHVQARIFEMQIEKQRIMADLERDLALLDNPFYTPELPTDAQQVRYDAGKYVTYDAVGNPFLMTLGDLLYDGDWGVKYACDPGSVSKHVQKKFLVETAKRKIRDLYNKQIVHDALASDKVPEDRKQSFKWFTEAAKREHEPGWIAERMVENVVRKACIDRDLDIRLSPATAFEDVEEKIDFIADRKQHAAGVGVESLSNGIERVGIQFTISRVARGKNAKIENAKTKYAELLKARNIKDIVLIKLQVKGAQQKYLEWKRNGMPPGGPELLVNPNVRKKMLKYIMGTLYEEDELQEALARIGEEPANDNQEAPPTENP